MIAPAAAPTATAASNRRREQPDCQADACSPSRATPPEAVAGIHQAGVAVSILGHQDRTAHGELFGRHLLGQRVEVVPSGPRSWQAATTTSASCSFEVIRVASMKSRARCGQAQSCHPPYTRSLTFEDADFTLGDMSVVRATSLSNYPRLVKELGGDPVALLTEVGIDPDAVGHDDVFVLLGACRCRHRECGERDRNPRFRTAFSPPPGNRDPRSGRRGRPYLVDGRRGVGDLREVPDGLQPRSRPAAVEIARPTTVIHRLRGARPERSREPTGRRAVPRCRPEGVAFTSRQRLLPCVGTPTQRTSDPFRDYRTYFGCRPVFGSPTMGFHYQDPPI